MDISALNNTGLLPYVAFMGLGFLVAEFILPTKGVLGGFGLLFFVVGTIALTHAPDPGLHLSTTACIILNVLVFSGVGVVLYVTQRGYRLHKGDAFNMAGKTATVVDWTEKHQRVETGGAIWLAVEKDGQPLKHGQTVRIVKQDNITLTVEPAGDQA